VKRIFATLAVFSNVLMLVAFGLGWTIGDAASRDLTVQQHVAWHFLTAVGALMFAALVHAILLTYFMGTGRWLEETSQAYSLGTQYAAEGKSLKYRTLPWMAVALLLLITTGGFGAVADPASPAGLNGIAGISAATVHFLTASFTIAVNAVINLLEYSAIDRNSQIIQTVLDDVHRIRREKGLPVE
jgi:hypothetical protein